MDTDSISRKKILKHDSIISNGDRPALRICGEYLFSSYITALLDYPGDGWDCVNKDGRRYNYNISGEVVVGVSLNKEGLITGYSIINSMKEGYFDEEALNTITSIPMEFLPKYKNGIPEESQYNIWVRFIRNKFD
jgi:TonB family protein